MHAALGSGHSHLIESGPLVPVTRPQVGLTEYYLSRTKKQWQPHVIRVHGRGFLRRRADCMCIAAGRRTARDPHVGGSCR